MPAPEPQNFQLALIQSALHWEDQKANLAHFENLLPQVQGADLTLLPEMFPTGFSMNPQKLSEHTNGTTLAWLQEMAEKFSTALSGSVIIKESSKFYNQLYFVEPNGHYHIYRKRHLFTLAGEEKAYQPGTEKLVLEYKGWRINPQICYDLRFPAWCRNQEHFDLQYFVANWPARRSFAWKSLLTARAIENQCYVAGLNRVGPDGNNVDHSGDSRVLDPLGELVWKAPAGEAIVHITKLNYQHLQGTRKRFAFLNDQDRFLIT